MIIFKFIIIVLVSYLIGAIPWGVIVTRFTKGVDIRDYGSSSTGVTNVTRTAGKLAGLLVFFLDVAKGIVVVFIARAIIGADSEALQWARSMAPVFSVIGHCYSVYIKFTGGRGVTVAWGGIMVLDWRIGLICIAVFILTILITKYVSLGSILGTAIAIPMLIVFMVSDDQPYQYLVYGVLVTVIIIFRHRGNIQRLLSGTERKLGQKAEKIGRL